MVISASLGDLLGSPKHLFPLFSSQRSPFSVLPPIASFRTRASTALQYSTLWVYDPVLSLDRRLQLPDARASLLQSLCLRIVLEQLPRAPPQGLDCLPEVMFL